MLGDNERKILRVVVNLIQNRGRIPSIEEIGKLAGRSPAAVRGALRVLADQGYILWSPERHATMQIVKAWEDHQVFGATPEPSTRVDRTIRPWWEQETRGYKDV